MTGYVAPAHVDDSFLELVHCGVQESSPQRAVARQASDATLDNHVGVRHASALFAVGYAAGRALAQAQVGAGAAVELTAAEIAYKQVGIGPLDATAIRTDPDGPPLETSVTITNAEGRVVATLALAFRACAAPVGS